MMTKNWELIIEFQFQKLNEMNFNFTGWRSEINYLQNFSSWNC